MVGLRDCTSLTLLNHRLRTISASEKNGICTTVADLGNFNNTIDFVWFMNPNLNQL